MKRIALAFGLAMLPATASAFPENVRNGYVNCTSCHVSPTGGGVLTAYGRELSRELLSTWGQEKGEADFLYGLIEPPEWLKLGGDVRMLQLYRDTPTVREAEFIPMQIDVEAAASHSGLTLDATFGKVYIRRDHDFLEEFVSRRHYLMYRPSEEISIRVGKFMHQFGLNVADHAIATRRGLGWDISNEYGYETYNVESAWLGESLNVFVTGIAGRPDRPSINREKGFSVAGSGAFLERYKVGGSYFYGGAEGANRHVAGPWGILGFTERFFLLTEWDLVRRPAAWGFVNYQRLNYEVLKGLHFFLTEDISKSDFGQSGSLVIAYGAGAQFFPRPHWELELLLQNQGAPASPLPDSTIGWFLLHFYL